MKKNYYKPIIDLLVYELNKDIASVSIAVDFNPGDSIGFNDLWK